MRLPPTSRRPIVFSHASAQRSHYISSTDVRIRETAARSTIWIPPTTRCSARWQPVAPRTSIGPPAPRRQPFRPGGRSPAIALPRRRHRVRRPPGHRPRAVQGVLGRGAPLRRDRTVARMWGRERDRSDMVRVASTARATSTILPSRTARVRDHNRSRSCADAVGAARSAAPDPLGRAGKLVRGGLALPRSARL